MNNKLTSIIAELPEEEDNTNSYRTPKGSFNRSMAIDKDINEVLSKTEYRPSLPMQNQRGLGGVFQIRPADNLRRTARQGGRHQ